MLVGELRIHLDEAAHQKPLFFSAQGIPKAASHPFYAKVNAILERNKVDKRLEHLCKRFYKPVMGRPSMAPCVLSDAAAGLL